MHPLRMCHCSSTHRRRCPVQPSKPLRQRVMPVCLVLSVVVFVLVFVLVFVVVSEASVSIVPIAAVPVAIVLEIESPSGAIVIAVICKASFCWRVLRHSRRSAGAVVLVGSTAERTDASGVEEERAVVWAVLECIDQVESLQCVQRGHEQVWTRWGEQRRGQV